MTGRTACQTDPDAWFDETRITETQALCSACPMLVRCRQLGRHEPRGMWGGVWRDRDANVLVTHRKGKRFCKRGHDRLAVGTREGNKECMGCYHDRNVRQVAERAVIRAAKAADTTVCRMGHSLVDAEAYVNNRGHTGRRCMTCYRARNKRSYETKRAAVLAAREMEATG